MYLIETCHTSLKEMLITDNSFDIIAQVSIHFDTTLTNSFLEQVYCRK